MYILLTLLQSFSIEFVWFLVVYGMIVQFWILALFLIILLEWRYKTRPLQNLWGMTKNLGNISMNREQRNEKEQTEKLNICGST